MKKFIFNSLRVTAVALLAYAFSVGHAARVSNDRTLLASWSCAGPRLDTRAACPTQDRSSFINGVDTTTDGGGEVTEQRLYQLLRVKGHIADRTFEIEFLDPGVEAFAFTFG